MSGDIHRFSIEDNYGFKKIKNIKTVRMLLASIINQDYNLISLFEKMEDEFIEINEKIVLPGDHYYAFITERKHFYFRKDNASYSKYCLFDTEGKIVSTMPSRSMIYIDNSINWSHVIEPVIKHRKDEGYDDYDSQDENYNYDDIYDSITSIEAIESYIEDILKININNSVISFLIS
jgi:hypothetical protein